MHFFEFAKVLIFTASFQKKKAISRILLFALQFYDRQNGIKQYFDIH